MLRLHAHCFVASEQTRLTIEEAFRNRRLARLTPTILPGGFAAAIERYAQETSPPLIVMEVDGSADALAGQVAALAETCDAGSNLILLGETNDIDIYRRLRRLGVAEYLRLPLDSAGFVETLAAILENPADAAKGHAIAIVGAVGGCGASTLAANIAYLLSRRGGDEAVVLDLDVAFGAADLVFNVDSTAGARAVFGEPDRIDEPFLQRFAARCGDRLSLLAAPYSLDADLKIDPDRLDLVVEALRRQVHWVVLDLPHLWTSWVHRALTVADAVVVVTAPDLAGVRNTRALLDWLAQARVGAPAPVVVVNAAPTERRPMVGLRDFREALGVVEALDVPEDRTALRAASSNGRLLVDIRPKSKAAVAIRELADRLAADAPRNRSKSAAPSKPLDRLKRLLFGRRE